MDRLGRFEIAKKLGEGGMGAVYEARDPELGRKVAIKLLRGGNTLRLMREAQALAKLAHPNVIAVYEMDTHDDQVFIVMELVDGVTIDRHLAGKPWRDIVAAYAAAGRGLAAVHATGLVHRDVKPSNILVDQGGRVRLGDFGLARVAEATDPPPVAAATVDPEGATRTDDGRGNATPAMKGELLASPITAVGSIVGTPAYMAPEQRGSADVTAKADQYAFCVSLCEALTGARNVTDKLRALPRWLAAAIARGLATEPEARWPSMTALVDELERHRPAKRYAIGAAAVVAIALGGFALARGGTRVDCDGAAGNVTLDAARRRAIEASMPADTAKRTLAALDAWLGGWRGERIDACRAVHERGEESAAMLDRRAGCLDAQLAAFDALASELARADAKNRALDAVGNLPAPELCSAARLANVSPSLDPRAIVVQHLIAAAEASHGLRRSTATEASAKAVAAARALRDPALLAQALIADARAIRGSDRNRARAELEEAQDNAARAHDPAIEADALYEIVADAAATHDAVRIETLLPNYRAAVTRSGDSRSQRLDLAETEADAALALGHADEARAACKRAIDLADDDRARSIATDCPCSVAFQTRDVAGAVSACKAAYDQRVRNYGDDSAKVKGGVDIYAIALERAGRAAEAETLIVENIARTERVFGRKSTEMLDELGNYSAAQDAQGKHAEAAATLRQGLALLDDMNLARDPHRYGFLSDLSGREATLGDYAAAVRDGDAALAAGEQLLGPDHPELLPVLLNDAHAHHAVKETDKAKALFERAVALAEAKRPGSSIHGGILADYGGFLIDTGHARDAVAVLQKAVEVQRKAKGNPAFLASALRSLGEAQIKAGHRADAKPALDEARAAYLALHRDKDVAKIDAMLASGPR